MVIMSLSHGEYYQYLQFSLHQVLFKYYKELNEWAGIQFEFQKESNKRKLIYELFSGVTLSFVLIVAKKCYHFRIPADEPTFVRYLETDWSICKAELQSRCWAMLLRSWSPSCGPSVVGWASFLTPALVVSCSKYSLPFAWPQPAESQWIYAKPSFLREDPACDCEPVFSTLGSDSLSQHLHP